MSYNYLFEQSESIKAESQAVCDPGEYLADAEDALEENSP